MKPFAVVVVVVDNEWWKDPLNFKRKSSAYLQFMNFMTASFRFLDFVEEIDNFLSKNNSSKLCMFFSSCLQHFRENWYVGGTTPKPFVKSMSPHRLARVTTNTHKRQWQPFSHNWFCVDHQFRALWPVFSFIFFRRANLIAAAAAVDEPTKSILQWHTFYSLKLCACVYSILLATLHWI